MALDEIYGQTLQIWEFLKTSVTSNVFNEIYDFIPQENTYYNMKEACTLEVILAINLQRGDTSQIHVAFIRRAWKTTKNDIYIYVTKSDKLFLRYESLKLKCARRKC